MAATVFKNPTFWIAERCAILRREYKTTPAKILCDKLGCTEAAVRRQALRMGVHKARRRKL